MYSNLLNHPSFDNPVAVLTDPNWQLAAKIVF